MRTMQKSASNSRLVPTTEVSVTFKMPKPWLAKRGKTTNFGTKSYPTFYFFPNHNTTETRKSVMDICVAAKRKPTSGSSLNDGINTADMLAIIAQAAHHRLQKRACRTVSTRA